MANKRFLGLGFSFSATDKGLESKLKGINSALQDITESLSSIGSQAATAGGAIGSIKEPKIKTPTAGAIGSIKAPREKIKTPVGGTGMDALVAAMDELGVVFGKGITRLVKRSDRIVAAIKKTHLFHHTALKTFQDLHDHAQTTKPFEPKQKKNKMSHEGDYEDIESKLSKSSQSFIKNIKKSLNGKELTQQFEKQLRTIWLSIDETGNLSVDSANKLHRFTKDLIETSEKIDKFQKNFNFAKKGFEAISGWFHRIGNSFETFLGSVGLDLRSVIPEQLTALAGLAKTIVSPLVKGIIAVPKMILDKTFKSQSDISKNKMKESLQKVQSNTEELARKAIPEMSAQITTGLDSLQKVQLNTEELARKTTEASAKITAGLDSVKTAVAPDSTVKAVNEMSAKLGGKPSATDNTNNLLKEVVTNTVPEKKGIFGGMKDSFKGLLNLIPGIGIVTGLFGLLSKAISAIVSAFELGTGALGKVLVQVVKGFGTVLGLALAAADVLVFLQGFGETIQENWKVFQDFGKNLSHFSHSFVKFVGNLFGGIGMEVAESSKQLGESVPIIGKFLDLVKIAGDKISTIGSGISDSVKNLYKSLPEGLKTTMDLIGTGIRAIFEFILNFFTNPLKDLQEGLSGIKQWGKWAGKALTSVTGFLSEGLSKTADFMDQSEMSTPTPAPMVVIPPKDDLSKLIVEQTDQHSAILTQQLQTMQAQNDFLNQILKATRDGKTLTANIKVSTPGVAQDHQMQALTLGIQ